MNDWQDLIDRHGRTVWTIAYRLVNDAADADDLDLPRDLFRVQVPDAYALIDKRPEERERRLDGELVLTPGVGIGPIRFGMDREAVIEAMGEPDSTAVKKDAGVSSLEKLLESTESPQMKDAIRQDIKRLKRSEIYRVGLESLKYGSLGFEVRLLPSKGVIALDCSAQQGYRSRDFRGRTSEGVGMFDSQQEIEGAYGQATSASEKGEYRTLRYPNWGLTFDLRNGKLVRLQAVKPD